MNHCYTIKNLKFCFGRIILNASLDGVTYNQIIYKKHKDPLINLSLFFKDYTQNKFKILYYCSRCKFFYVYYKICDSHKKWFKNYKLKLIYLKPFTLLFYKIWNKEKNESGYYLININAWGYEYNYLVNYRLYKNFYRLLNLTLDKPIQKYAAFVKSKYAYINFKRKFIFYPISYKELEKWKFNYKKIQNKYKYFNTFYNKYEILTIKILDFINSHIEYLTDIEYKKLQNKVYKLCITSDINLQNFILGLYNAALNKYEIHKLKYYKKDSGIYINTRRSKNRVFKSFNIIVEQYRKCYKYERKFIKKIV